MARQVLIIDDTAFMRMTLKNILEKNGYQVVGEAEDGQVAVDKYMELRPDLVIMDITMPRMDGITAIKKIIEADPEAKIVVCSAMGQKALVIEALSAGAKDFIVKPFQAERIINAVQKVIG
ncbi:two-component system, chemotaxis family, chemotaxis protein CheY [Candidatus Hakubella thermalkaliphila]|uniref:Two-component system, chemotaxis family, chemotaxis protein CheY n=3 Tax=Candidatus Hakubella thermalkaliphila TaxID=2754717 RepID=A0A6V8P051_9ACTN|nr:two-component system, chemotaxis family, chemotaxis protein CheY [Candidatus Hakubella thermalkaliphila]